MAVILGINAFHAGASAALIIEGKPVVAIAEERLNRIKYYAKFPGLSIRRCLKIAGLNFKDIDYVAVGSNPFANRSKKISYAVKHPVELLNLLKIRAARCALSDLKPFIVQECGVNFSDLRFKQFNIEHHIAHIASAYFISPWDRCAGFSMDGSGDFVTCMFAKCFDNQITPMRRTYLPQSLGLFYFMICEFLGYQKYGDEGKVMGLAPYGEDRYGADFEDMISLTKNSFRLNLKYFMLFNSNQDMSINEKGEMKYPSYFSKYMIKCFGQPRKPYADITKRDRDCAFGVQNTFEKVYLYMLNLLHKLVPEERLAMAGGAAFNSVANGKIFDSTPFRETIIQPATGDEGLALGAALYVSRSILKENIYYKMNDSYLGPEYSEEEIKKELEREGVPFVRLSREELLQSTVDAIKEGSVVGWFQGRMEWGPRALGNRSILANPSLSNMKGILNTRIKKRESFRPFAPSVLAERQADIFECGHPSPFMQHVYKIKPDWRKLLVAVNHIDNTGRLQSVTQKQNSLYYDLIKLYEKETGVPVLLNTSFNENEPIVCSPKDAILCFLKTKIDILVIGSFICVKDGFC